MLVIRSIVSLALVALVIPACDDNNDVITDPVQDSVDVGFARGNAFADTAFAELGGADYTIVLGKTASIIAALNDGELDQADFALQTVIAGDIANYAGLIFDDHDQANADLDNVVAIFGVGFIGSDTESDVRTDYTLGLDFLRSSPPGELDFDYIDQEVQNHAASTVLLAQLRDMLANDEMGRYVDNLRAVEDDHLARAEDLLATFF